MPEAGYVRVSHKKPKIDLPIFVKQTSRLYSPDNPAAGCATRHFQIYF